MYEKFSFGVIFKQTIVGLRKKTIIIFFISVYADYPQTNIQRWLKPIYCILDVIIRNQKKLNSVFHDNSQVFKRIIASYFMEFQLIWPSKYSIEFLLIKFYEY